MLEFAFAHKCGKIQKPGLVLGYTSRIASMWGRLQVSLVDFLLFTMRFSFIKFNVCKLIPPVAGDVF